MNKEKRNEVLDVLIKELKHWKRTNDIMSPTHYTDLREFLQILELDENTEDKLCDHMRKILNIVKPSSRDEQV